MSKNKGKTAEELLQEALVPVEEQPYRIPENWVWVRLKYISTASRSGIEPSKYQDEVFELYSVPSFVNNAPEILLGKEINSNKQVVEENDVLICKINPRINRVWIVNKKNKYMQIASTEWIVVSNYRMYSRYLMYLFRSPYFRSVLTSNVSGVGGSLTRARPNDVNKYPIAIPPLNEQKRIADKIERLLSKINLAKQLIEEAKETYELRRAAILDKAFRGELTAKWRKENPNLIDGDELYEKIKEERFDAIETNREAIEVKQIFEAFTLEESVDSNNWIYLKANMFCFNISCGGTPSEHISESGEIPFLKVYNIVDNKVAFDYKSQFISKEISNSKLKKSVLNPKDVIMNIVGPPLKKIAIIPDDFSEWNMNQAIVRFRPIRSVLPEYVYYCLQFEDTLKEVINQTKGVVGQSNISISQSRNLIMPIPSTEEQKEIVAILDCLIEKENQMLDRLRGLQKNLDLTEQSILSKAFKGELGTNSDSDGSAHDMFLQSLGGV
ncbi:restriction endonuclease subunit S [Paenibacillus sp. FSL K6-1217]|uniref:restriction endonuclease subunit S n=1 Tax=Paenibacillus sp. FSL K6-1217 TaxID=2921466 RepID=UPI003248C6C9